MIRRCVATTLERQLLSEEKIATERFLFYSSSASPVFPFFFLLRFYQRCVNYDLFSNRWCQFTFTAIAVRFIDRHNRIECVTKETSAQNDLQFGTPSLCNSIMNFVTLSSISVHGDATYGRLERPIRRPYFYIEKVFTSLTSRFIIIIIFRQFYICSQLNIRFTWNQHETQFVRSK